MIWINNTYTFTMLIPERSISSGIDTFASSLPSAFGTGEKFSFKSG